MPQKPQKPHTHKSHKSHKARLENKKQKRKNNPPYTDVLNTYHNYADFYWTMQTFTELCWILMIHAESHRIIQNYVYIYI